MVCIIDAQKPRLRERQKKKEEESIKKLQTGVTQWEQMHQRRLHTKCLVVEVRKGLAVGIWEVYLSWRRNSKLGGQNQFKIISDIYSQNGFLSSSKYTVNYNRKTSIIMEQKKIIKYVEIQIENILDRQNF